ncbi:hypothetical protein P691DRAFT_756492 [Macrolepiota fuliginosa MF-IS2]|uniref:Inhibitor I9 domain-containing protein n=1 Tax=Macrolepiota fuliginosa MF-IS2 TaxID=1400762 RepID=A0A9P6C5E7_9AGAR|nr:hypothetical protein P691DRAFT_756492 [Macrolepiota fuliginosa MF-IS2]
MSGRYIIVFKDKATRAEIEQFIDHLIAEGKIHAHYDALFKGFSASVPDNLVSLFAVDRIIDFIEPDGIVTTQV